jgi:DNA polymerase-3 subunit delta
MARTRKDLEQSLKQDQIEPVYLLYGSETYLRDRAANDIAEAALAGTLLREFNDSTFDLTTDKISSAIAAAEQLPLMSGRRVVRIKNLDKLEGRRKVEEDEDAVNPSAQVLLDYLARPVATSVVIFITEDVDKRRKYAKTLLSGAAYEFSPLKPNELPVWIKSHLKTLKADIDLPALNRLLEVVAPDLLTITNELNKLVAAALPTGRITVALVDQLVSRSREHMNWDLTDAIVSRNGKKALKVLREFLDDGVEPVLLTGVIAGTFRRLALAKEMFARGASPAEIFSAVRVTSWKQREYLSMLSRTDARQLQRAIIRIAETDLAIKTSKATPRMQVEMLVCELMI